MARAPKVYAADLDGVHEWIVAAPNMRAALDALGVRQDLFAQGRAQLEADPGKIEAALARPGVALRRTKGSSEVFEPASDSASGWAAALKAVPPAQATKARKPSRGATPAAAVHAGPSVDQRCALRDAEAALNDFERDAIQSLDDFGEERVALDRRERTARADLDQRRKALIHAADQARAAMDD